MAHVHSHNFGRSVPPPIKTLETLKQKMNLLDAMADVELAQSILKETAKDDTHNVYVLRTEFVTRLSHLCHQHRRQLREAQVQDRARR